MNPSDAIKLLEKVDATNLNYKDCQNFNSGKIQCSKCFLDNYCTELGNNNRSEVINDLKKIIRKEKLEHLLKS